MSALISYRGLQTGRPPRLSSTAVCVLSIIAVATCGCGTVLYKPGSTASDYQAARDHCDQQGRAKNPAFERCMEEQGWSVKQLGEPAGPNGVSRNASAKRSSVGLPGSPAAGGVAPPSTVSNVGGAPATARPIIIKNWFKLGATAADLEAAKKRCTAKLGTAAGAAPDSLAVTPAMLECLRNQGWRAF
jgi:hypothetical protein